MTIHIPSEGTWLKLNNERSGIWMVNVFNSSDIECVVKFQSSILKSILKGVPIALSVAVVEVEDQRFRFLGLIVYDDEAHPVVTTHPSRTVDEHDLLGKLFTQSSVKIHFFDEKSLPSFSMTCHLDLFDVQKVSDRLLITAPHYVGEITRLVLKGHDYIDQAFQQNNYLNVVFCEQIKINPENAEPVNVSESGKRIFRIDDSDEGLGFEQATLLPLEAVFRNNVFRSPMVRKGSIFRELTDFLMFSDTQVCLVEAKALAVLNSKKTNVTSKRVSAIDKDIKKAFRQLKGALRVLRSDGIIFDELGNTIDFTQDSSTIFHVIILLSEINPFLDRAELARELVSHSDVVNRIFFHILDLEELVQLVANIQTPEMFSTNLLVRWRTVWENGDILVRYRRPPQGVSPLDLLREHGVTEQPK